MSITTYWPKPESLAHAVTHTTYLSRSDSVPFWNCEELKTFAVSRISAANCRSSSSFASYLLVAPAALASDSVGTALSVSCPAGSSGSMSTSARYLLFSVSFARSLAFGPARNIVEADFGASGGLVAGISTINRFIARPDIWTLRALTPR